MDQFKFEKLEFEGAYLIHPFFSSDNRGGFIKDYNVDIFNRYNLHHNLKEVFYTISHRGTIRAIHFQLNRQQAKLVRCLKGRIFDVIVDLRKDSKSYGKWLSFELSEENRKEIYIPKFFGHGYLVLEDAIVSYKCDEVFFAEGDSGIRYDDPALNIVWPFDQIGGIEKLIISEKDLNLMSFKEYTNLI